MKVAAAFTLLAAATSASANVIPSGTAPLYPMTAVAATGASGTSYFYSVQPPTWYPTAGGTGGVGSTGAFPPAPTNGTYTSNPTGTVPNGGGATATPPSPPPPSQTTAPPSSGASRNGACFLALAGVAAAFVMS